MFDICNLKRTERHHDQMVHCPMLPLPHKGDAGQDDREHGHARSAKANAIHWDRCLFR